MRKEFAEGDVFKGNLPRGDGAVLGEDRCTTVGEMEGEVQMAIGLIVDDAQGACGD